jgi:hypothetical protein
LRIISEAAVINFLNGFNRQPAGFLAALVSAHAVGDYRQPSFAMKFFIVGGFPIEVRVLIIFTLAANVAQARHFNVCSYMHVPMGQLSLPNSSAKGDQK